MIDPAQALQQAKDALDKAIEDKRRSQDFVKSIGPAIIDTLKPVLNEIASNSRIPKDELLKAISNIKIPEIKIPEPNVTVNAPSLPAFPKIPEPKVTVNVPPIKIPEIKMPEEMDIRGWVQLQGVNLQNPLPVQLRDAKGKAINLFENLTTLVGGGGGGFQVVKVSEVLSSVPITSGSTLIMDQVSGAIWSVSVNDIFRTTVASNLINSDDRLRVSVETGGGDLTDAQLRASSVPVAQASGASWSVEASQVNSWLVSQVSGANWSVEMASQPFTFDVKQVSGSADSVNASQVGTWIVDQLSGASWSVAATKSGLWDIDQLSGANWSVFATNPVGQGDAATALRIVVAGNSDVSVSATQVGSWTVSLSGSLSSAVAVGPSAVGIADDGNAPIQIGGIARTTNPTKVTDGQVVKSSHDAVGRQLMRPVQVRGLLQTAYLSLTTGTEATLLAGSASTFFDLVYLMATNNSDAAVTVDFRSATGAGIVTSVRVPANGTAGVSLGVPLPQDAAADTWTADMPDITGTTVTIGALFSKEV